MRLTAKWFIWFGVIGAYVMFLGGIFYYNLFKWTFDEKLKQDAIELVRIYAPTLHKGLQKNLRAITFDEYGVMQTLMKDERMASILYLNKFGEVRWYKDSTMIGQTYEDFQVKVGLPTNAVEQAFISKTPKVRAVPDKPYYEVAIPLAVRNDVLGIVDLIVSRKKADNIVRSAMVKYVVGAIGVLFLMGVPLFFFLRFFVLSPLGALRDAIDGINPKNMEIKAQTRKDEVGDISEAIAGLLRKLRLEIAQLTDREAHRADIEASWWRTLLGTVVPAGCEALVVDEDNNVLFANFDVPGVSAGGKTHLLDVVDSQQQDLLRLIGMALEKPNELMQGDTVFHSEQRHVKVVHLAETGELKRTLVLFQPMSQAQAGAPALGAPGAPPPR